MKPELHIEPEVIVRKARHHGHAHHGGAWKIAYADFVTAMMAFFMLLWIIGATNEDQRKGIADYFTPTVIQMKNSGGSNGIMGGRSLTAEDGMAPAQTMGARPSARAGGGTTDTEIVSTESRTSAGLRRQADDTRYRKIREIIDRRLAGDPTLVGLKGQIRLVRLPDGLRIDIVERADFPMFASGTSVFTPAALALMRSVAAAIAETPSRLVVRGHTDSTPYAQGSASNWSLSTLRADATRRVLADAGISEARFRSIEGVADTDPFNPEDGTDPRNRRISIILLNR
jgi:chemotaxis protein MotB